MLDKQVIQPTNFRTKNWVEIKDDKCRAYDTNSQIKCKTTMLKSSSDAYILMKGMITITGAGADAAARQVDEKKISNIQKFVRTIHWLH